MTETPNPDWLDEMLSEEPAYIDDAGFTAQVVQALPARRHTWMIRRLILGLAALTSIGFGWMALPAGQDITTWTQVALKSAFSSPMLSLSLIAMIGLTFISASVAWVMQEK